MENELEALILWPPDAKSWLIRKDPDAGKDWRPEGEEDDRGWDGGMASLTQWTWVWASSGSCWRTGKPGMLQSMASQRVGHDWVTTTTYGKGQILRIKLNLRYLYLSQFHTVNQDTANYSLFKHTRQQANLLLFLSLNSSVKQYYWASKWGQHSSIRFFSSVKWKSSVCVCLQTHTHTHTHTDIYEDFAYIGKILWHYHQ